MYFRLKHHYQIKVICLRYISNICIISGKFRHKVQSIIDFDTFPGTKLNCSDTVPQPEAIQQVCALTDEYRAPLLIGFGRGCPRKTKLWNIIRLDMAYCPSLCKFEIIHCSEFGNFVITLIIHILLQICEKLFAPLNSNQWSIIIILWSNTIVSSFITPNK
jgi:hypothetical protein